MDMKILLMPAKCRTHPTRRAGNQHFVPLLLTSVISSICSFSPMLMAAPQGGTVVAGTGTIEQVGNTTTLISQNSQSLAINWDTFNVNADETVKFNQPSSSAVALNRIVSQTPSQIFGHIDANGRVFLINPNGILFGKTATINVGSLLASTLNMDTDSFMQGNYTLSAAPDQTPGIVVNKGIIQAATGGSVTLVGGAVSNEGVILANLGQVNLAAGRKAVIDFDGDGLIGFEVSDDIVSNTQALASAVNNSGEITADGGEVLMKGAVAADVFSQVVNNSGIVKAARIDNQGGVIRLVGTNGIVVNSGAIDASGQGATDTGGRVEILGDTVALNDGSNINASGDAGGGTVLVGGDTHGSNPDIQNATQTTVSANTSINTDANVNGDGGKVVVWSDDTTKFYGDVSARGGAEGGNGGFVEISGKKFLTIPLSQVTIDMTALLGDAGNLLLDPGSVTICHAGATGCTSDQPNTFTDSDLEGLITGLTGPGNVTISTATPTTSTTEDITVNADVLVEWTNNNRSLTLDAGHDLIMGGKFLSSGSNAPLILNFGHDLNLGGAVFSGTGTLITTATNTTVNAHATNSGTTTVTHTITGENLDTNWTINGDNSGSLTNSTMGTVSFDFDTTATAQNDLLHLVGGTGADAFTLSDVVLAQLDGGTGSNTLNAPNTDNNWTTSGSANSGSIITGVGGSNLSHSFSNIQTLNGGTGVDGFILNKDVTGSINGGDNNDTFAINSAITGTINGGAGNDTFTLADVATTATIDGGANTDTLIASDTNNIWKISTGELTTSVGGATPHLHTFSNMENLTGGSQVDTFTLDANFTGTVSGGLGNDIFNLGDDVAVSGGIDGGGGTGDEVVAPNVANNLWAIIDATSGNLTTSKGTGTDPVQSFSNVETLTGGSSSDTVDLSGAGANQRINLQTGAIDAGGGTTYSYSFTGMESFVGNNLSATLIGPDIASTYAITTTNHGSVTPTAGGNSITFTGFNNLTGGSAADIFDIGADIKGATLGGDGNDTFNINAIVDADIDAGLGDDKFVFSSTGAISRTVKGGVGTDTIDFSAKSSAISVKLSDFSSNFINGGGANGFEKVETIKGATGVSNSVTGADSATTWAISGADKFTVSNTSFTNDIQFTDFGTITGGSGSDAFKFTNLAASISGKIAGGSGTDTLDFSDASLAATAVTVNLDATVSRTASFNNGGGTTSVNFDTDIESFKGAGSNDTLVGGNISKNSWTISAADTGSVGGFQFIDVSNLTAGTQGDTFSFSGSGSLTGKIAGGSGHDILDFSGLTATDPVTVNFSNNSTTKVFSGSANGISSIEEVVGNANANDTIIGANIDSAWDITGLNQGTISKTNAADTFSTVTFTNIKNLTGGSGVDTFTVGANVTGTLDGGSGNDFFNINTNSIAGTIDGNSGTDTLNFSGTGTAVTINLNDQSATFINSAATNGFSSIESMIGGGSNDTLVGANATNTWNITNTDKGNVVNTSATVDFDGISNLTGGSNTDNFVIGANVNGTIAGGSGDDNFYVNTASFTGAINGTSGTNDTLSFASTGTAVTINLDSNTAKDTGTLAPITGGFSNIDTIVGGGNDDTLVGGNSSANIWTINGADVGSVGGVNFSKIGKLTAGTKGDTFSFESGGTLSGVIAGNIGLDILDFSNTGSPVTINIGNNSATPIASGSTNGFSSIETVKGGGGDDSLVAPDATNNTWDIAANGDGTVASMNFSGFSSLVGGSLNDTLTVAYDGTSTRTINFDGGAGTNSVTLTGGGSTLTGAYTPLSGTSGKVEYKQNINTETLNLSQIGSLTDNRSAAKLTVNGSGGNDSISLSGTSVGFTSLLDIAFANKTSLTVDGGVGTDTVNITGTNSFAAGTLEIDAESVTDTSGAAVIAGTLIVNGASTLGTSSAHMITNVGNLQLGNLTGSAYITENSGLNFNTSNIGGNLNLTTSGPVTQSGTLQVAGSTTVVAGSGAISLANDSNNFGGAVTLTNSGGVSISDANALSIGTISSSGNVTVKTNAGNLNLGHINTTGDVTLTVNGGNLVGDNSSQINPNIKGTNLLINVPSGGIGSYTNQVAVNISGTTTLFSSQIQAFLTGPTGTLTSGTNLIVNTSDIQGTAGRGQNLVASNIYFIDPALFSQDFSLFNITDNGIRLPPDQVEDQ